jgi:PadR family transcriptional regulator, regulatory protein PadR
MTDSAWLRGVLDLCLLALLASGETYGYDLARRLQAHGIGPVPGGSLYPALLRLETAGYLRAEWGAGQGGPGRKYYALTERGRDVLERDRQAWRAFAERVDGVLSEVSA